MTIRIPSWCATPSRSPPRPAAAVGDRWGDFPHRPRINLHLKDFHRAVPSGLACVSRWAGSDHVSTMPPPSRSSPPWNTRCCPGTTSPPANNPVAWWSPGADFYNVRRRHSTPHCARSTTTNNLGTNGGGMLRRVSGSTNVDTFAIGNRPWTQHDGRPVMSDPAVKIGCFRYDTTRALFDGSVTVAGAAPRERRPRRCRRSSSGWCAGASSTSQSWG